MDWVIEFAAWFTKYFVAPMIANASPLLVRGSNPIDFNKEFIDKKPIFGSSRTWEGLAISFYMGFSAVIAISIVLGEEPYLIIGLGSIAFANLGSLASSFTKRRAGISAGSPLPIVDQLDFALAVSLFYYLIGSVDFYCRPAYVLCSLTIIAVLHVLTNNVAYCLKIKDKRW